MCYESSLVCEINHWPDTSRFEASRSDAGPLAHLQLVSENVTKDDSDDSLNKPYRQFQIVFTTL